MIKNILIIILSVSTISSGIFALYQKDGAQRMRELAIESEREAWEMRDKVAQEKLINEIQEDRIDSLQSELRNLKASLTSQ